MWTGDSEAANGGDHRLMASAFHAIDDVTNGICRAERFPIQRHDLEASGIDHREPQHPVIHGERGVVEALDRRRQFGWSVTGESAPS